MNPTALAQAVRHKTVAFLVAIEFEVGEGRFAAGLAEIIENLVLQDAHQPAFLGAAALKLLPALERGEKGLLYGILGFGGIAQADHGVFEQVVAMVVHPPFRVGKSRAGAVRFIWSGW